MKFRHLFSYPMEHLNSGDRMVLPFKNTQSPKMLSIAIITFGFYMFI
jgi:hypothetical protein